MIVKRLLLLWIAVLVLLAFEDSGFSKEATTKYPERDIMCITGSPPGGGGDIISRIAGRYLEKYLPNKVNILVQNLAAAGGRAGWVKLYDAKPDGYTIGVWELLGPVVASTMGELGERDPMRMTYFHRVTYTTYMMGVGSKSPIQTAEDLKNVKGKKIRAACSQATVLPSIAILRLMGSEPQPVFYGGGADCCLAAMRGDVDVVITAGATLMRQSLASGGKLIPLLAFSESRLSFAPEVPIAKEIGINIPENLMAALTMHYIFLAPGGLPADVFKILNEALQKTIQDPGFAQDLERVKLPLGVLSPDQVRSTMSMLVEVATKNRDELLKIGVK